MNILIAPNAFKGSLSAHKVAQAIARGLQRSDLHCTTLELPIADGGDDSLHVISQHLGATMHATKVNNPLRDIVSAQYAKKGNFGVVEMAEASGIRLIKKEQLNPWRLTSHGTGELIMHLIDVEKVNHIYLTLGGSATVDGGIGLLSSLGVEFINAQGNSVPYVDMNMIMEIDHLDLASFHKKVKNVKFTILSDVTNPLLGDTGAAKIFGPQKGLIKEDIPKMEAALSHISELIKKAVGLDISVIEGGGAAGGIAASLFGLVNADILSGAEQILAWSGFNEKLKKADLVITAEGMIDEQTDFGKGPGLVASKAKAENVPVIGLSGAVDAELFYYKGFIAVLPIIDSAITLEEAMIKTAINLERSACQIGNILSLKIS